MILTLFTAVLSLAALYYAALIGFFAYGFRRVRRASIPGGPGPAPFVSIVIAARDEEATIASCLRSILGNTYPEERYEVIVVDDFSQDATAAVVRRLQRACHPVPAGSEAGAEEAKPRLRLLRMQDHASAATGHKRHALNQGIRHSRGEIILTTDADCTASPHWIRTMVDAFTPETGFVAGPVRYRPGRTLFGRLQALEFLALVATGAGGIGLGWPNMCNSANVGYRRRVYDRFGTAHRNGSVNPGDDEILAQHLAARTSWTVRFCASPKAMVETDPELDLRAFWHQRRRWAGTGPRYPRPGLVAAILGVYLFYVLLLAGLAMFPVAPALGPALGLALGLKVASEAALLRPACQHFGQHRLFRYFVPEQLVQIPYVVCVGVAAALGETHWKGRKVFA